MENLNKLMCEWQVKPWSHGESSERRHIETTIWVPSIFGFKWTCEITIYLQLICNMYHMQSEQVSVEYLRVKQWIISTAINQWDLAATPFFCCWNWNVCPTVCVCVSLKCPFPRKKSPVFSQFNWVNFHFESVSTGGWTPQIFPRTSPLPRIHELIDLFQGCSNQQLSHTWKNLRWMRCYEEKWYKMDQNGLPLGSSRTL